MAIIYDPDKMLKKIAPERKIERLVSSRLTFKKAALSFIDAADFIDKKAVSRVALDTIKSYQKRVKAEGSQSVEGYELEQSLIDDPKLLINRVQNAVVFQVSQEIKSKYSGDKYVWLPSDADEPDPEHQLNYGKTFTIGQGEMPGERYGCRCGMEILNDQTELNLD